MRSFLLAKVWTGQKNKCMFVLQYCRCFIFNLRKGKMNRVLCNVTNTPKNNNIY